MLTKDDIEQVAQWSAPRRVNTKRGPRLLRTAKPTAALGELLDTRKAEAKAAGLGLSDYSGRLEAVWWLEIDPEPANPPADRPLAPDEIRIDGEILSRLDIEMIRTGLAKLAGVKDQLDIRDRGMILSLARAGDFSPPMALMGIKMLRRYAEMLPAGFVKGIGRRDG